MSALHLPLVPLSTEPKPFVLVGCSLHKLDKPAPAKDLYQGDLFLKAREYAESIGADWRILSARFGLVHPEDVIPPYDVCLDKMRAEQVRDWGHRTGIRLHLMLLGDKRQIIVLAGKSYRDPLFSSLQGRLYAAQVMAPLAGLGIGQQKAWLIRATQKAGAA